MTFRLLVTGSRDWTDRDAVHAELERVASRCERLIVVHGACPTGADRIADEWARVEEFRARIWSERHPADWSLGARAGPLRNQRMVDAGADLCLAFWNGVSRGTLDCLTRAVKAGISVRVVPARKERKRG